MLDELGKEELRKEQLRKEELGKEQLRKEQLKEKTLKKMLENGRKEQEIFDETNKMRKDLKKQIEVLSLSKLS